MYVLGQPKLKYFVFPASLSCVSHSNHVCTGAIKNITGVIKNIINMLAVSTNQAAKHTVDCNRHCTVNCVIL